MTTTVQAPAPNPDLVLAVFDRHSRWDALCLICGKPGGSECGSCTANHDTLVARSCDV